MGELTSSEKNTLLKIARAAIQGAVEKKELETISVADQTDTLKENGASFVTLTINDRLRGCIGTMEPHQPLVLDVQEHAIAAAMNDYRFSSVRIEELEMIKIEISRLTPLKKLHYSSVIELCKTLRIGIDGVLISAQGRRATYLPQVWEQLPTPEEFLSHLCVKMGKATNFWQHHPMEVFTYEVEKFSEP